MTIRAHRPAQLPTDHRLVPLLCEPELGHYPEFRRFFEETFELARDPLGSAGQIDVGDRSYAVIFTGRSGQCFPSGVELCALVAGLEPLAVDQADRDVWAILEWIIENIGTPWSVEALKTTGRIYRIPAAESD